MVSQFFSGVSPYGNRLLKPDVTAKVVRSFSIILTFLLEGAPIFEQVVAKRVNL